MAQWSSRAEPLRRKIEGALAARLSPEGIRAATLTERLTVCRLSWDRVVRLNRYLAAVGKVATGIFLLARSSIGTSAGAFSASCGAVTSTG